MPALQIKDCPLDTYEELKCVAQEENRSISQQMLTIVQQYLAARNKGRNAARFGAPGFDTYEERCLDGTIDYAEKHRRVFERLHELPRLRLPDGYTTADFVQEAREERC